MSARRNRLTRWFLDAPTRRAEKRQAARIRAVELDIELERAERERADAYTATGEHGDVDAIRRGWKR